MSSGTYVHFPITKVCEQADNGGALKIVCGIWPAMHETIIFTGSPSLALVLCAAMNEVLAKHKPAPAEPLSVVLNDDIPF